MVLRARARSLKISPAYLSLSRLVIVPWAVLTIVPLLCRGPSTFCMRLGLDFKTFFCQVKIRLYEVSIYHITTKILCTWIFDKNITLETIVGFYGFQLGLVFTGELEPWAARRWMMWCRFITKYVRGKFLRRSSQLGSGAGKWDCEIT